MYYADEPILNQENDLLGRAEFAKKLAKSIVDSRTDDPICIGLFGRWGSGKTSIVNMMIEEIKTIKSGDEEPVIIRFEPWNFSSTDQLMRQFFLQMLTEFKAVKGSGMKSIGKAIEKYADAFDFAGLFSAPWGPAAAILGKAGLLALGECQKTFSFEEQDISRQKEQVIQLLRKETRKIVVIIDDIDRLSNEQIRTIFQLVTAVADFPNTMYVLSFDWDIVIKALEDVQKGDGNEYLEKVIQIPIRIPDARTDELWTVLLSRMDEIRRTYSDTRFEESRWQQLFQPCIAPFVKTLRDVNRLCNLVQFKLVSIGSEVNFADMVAISTLELHMPEVLTWIKDHKLLLTKPAAPYDTRKEMTPDDLEIQCVNELKRIRRSHGTADKESEINLLVEALAALFPSFGYRIGAWDTIVSREDERRNNRISHPGKFDRYFDLDLTRVAVRKEEVEAAVKSMGEEQLVEDLLERTKQAEIHVFLEEMRAHIPEIEPHRARVLTRALFRTGIKFYNRSTTLILDSKRLAATMIRQLIQRFPQSERCCFLLDTLRQADTDMFHMFAEFFRQEANAPSGLIGYHSENSSKVLFTDDEFRSIESAFCSRGKELIKEGQSILTGYDRAFLTIYLMWHFDAPYTRKYMEDILRSDWNKLVYLNSVAEVAFDGRYIVSRVFLENCDAFLPAEQIYDVLEHMYRSGEFFSLPENLQHASAAYLICKKGDQENQEGPTYDETEALLTRWRSEATISQL